MHLTCPLSSVQYRADGFAQLKLICPHPVFSVSISDLVMKTENWSKGQLDDIERRLLFLAMLKATEGVIFSVAAIPTNETINRHMEKVAKIAGWKAKVGDRISLPIYHITRDTYRLKNIGSWINSWEDEKARWERYGTGPSDWDLIKKLHDRERAIERVIMRPYNDLAKVQKRLARVVMDMMPTPKGIKDYWVDLLNLRDDTDIFNTPEVDLAELLEFMEDNLDAGTSIGHLAFKIVRDIVSKKRGGIALSIMDVDDLDDDPKSKTGGFKFKDYDALKANPYLIVEEHITNSNNIIPLNRMTETLPQMRDVKRELYLDYVDNFPAEEPKKEDFKDKPGMSWPKAVANWRMAKRIIEDRKAAELEKQKEAERIIEEDKKALDFLERPEDTTQPELEADAEDLELKRMLGIEKHKGEE